MSACTRSHVHARLQACNHEEIQTGCARERVGIDTHTPLTPLLAQDGQTPLQLAGNEEVKAAFADHLEYLDFGIMDDDKNMLLLECARRGLASRVRAALQAGAEAAYTDKVRVHA